LYLGNIKISVLISAVLFVVGIIWLLFLLPKNKTKKVAAKNWEQKNNIKEQPFNIDIFEQNLAKKQNELETTEQPIGNDAVNMEKIDNISEQNNNNKEEPENNQTSQTEPNNNQQTDGTGDKQ